MKCPPKKELRTEEKVEGIKCKIHKAERRRECCLQRDIHLKSGHCHALCEIWISLPALSSWSQTFAGIVRETTLVCSNYDLCQRIMLSYMSFAKGVVFTTRTTGATGATWHKSRWHMKRKSSNLVFTLLGGKLHLIIGWHWIKSWHCLHLSDT